MMVDPAKVEVQAIIVVRNFLEVLRRFTLQSVIAISGITIGVVHVGSHTKNTAENISTRIVSRVGAV